jgi:hypothetical protein
MKKIIILTLFLFSLGQTTNAATTLGTTKDGRPMLSHRGFRIVLEDQRRGLFKLIAQHSIFFLDVDPRIMHSASKKFRNLTRDQRIALTKHAYKKMQELDSEENDLQQKLHSALTNGALHLLSSASRGLHNILEQGMLFFVLQHTDLLDDLERNAIQSTR